MGDQIALPYWQVNVPGPDRLVDCPDFLLNISAKDFSILSTPDSDYHILTWDEVCQIAKANKLDHFQRVPSDLRRYKAYTFNLTKTYGSVADFVLNQRLQWKAPVRARGRPFEFEDDIKILINDWPYGIDRRIVHLVVWTKFFLEEDAVTGDLVDESRKEIDDFVTKTFRSHVPDDQIIWFKNWRGLKSVGAVEHFHVMMFNPDPDFIRSVTNGDVPQWQVFEN
ncbi:hypothetical protein BGZ61DRAFT_525395 [Ilyonectria robusta]|uniref:uncharacterized protein n=1 Tax=Ilyonectria robusta TaxID=1079257 RepID=UPI001E8CA306|nr:uncharacterized protein BGZ61DRAFT_525395 [Ilyonectria robusta]KAH8737233.1 hypothetical protein BGZ61DRAFT_525395 [Ilyonectria robusta]